MIDSNAVYYDYEPSIGINAYSQRFACLHVFYKSWGQFDADLIIEGLTDNLVEITPEVYSMLCAEGFFNDLH